VGFVSLMTLEMISVLSYLHSSARCRCSLRFANFKAKSLRLVYHEYCSSFFPLMYGFVRLICCGLVGHDQSFTEGINWWWDHRPTKSHYESSQGLLFQRRFSNRWRMNGAWTFYVSRKQHRCRLMLVRVLPAANIALNRTSARFVCY